MTSLPSNTEPIQGINGMVDIVKIFLYVVQRNSPAKAQLQAALYNLVLLHVGFPRIISCL